MSGIFSSSRLIRDPVPTSAALPIGSDMIGAIRVVLADSSVWVYNGTSWQQAGGGTVPLSSLDNVTIYLNGSSQVAIKPLGITDGLVSGSSSIIRNWSNTVAYAIGRMVVYNNAIWVATQASTNVTPALNIAQWKQVANQDSAQNYVYAPSITASPYNVPTTDTAAVFDTSAGDIIVNIPLLSSLVSSNTANKIQEFRFGKTSQPNAIIITLSGSDTFLDGTNTYRLVGQGVYSMYALFSSAKWAKG